MNLNGMWSFSFNGGKETRLPVPGCFDTEPEFRWKRGIGSYRRPVECGGRCELKFGAIGLRAEIFWDGVRIAEERTAYTPFTVRFDAGKKGRHELKVVCDNTYDESPESQFRVFYDFYGYGGIYRGVSLRELPESNLVYVRILPLDPLSGRISLHVETEGPDAPLPSRSTAAARSRSLPATANAGCRPPGCGVSKIRFSIRPGSFTEAMCRKSASDSARWKRRDIRSS